MFKNITAASTLVLFMLLHTWFAVAADQKLLEDITFEASPENVERITFKLTGEYIPTIFAIKGKTPRVVLDFKDIKPARLLKNIINTNGKFVKRIRMGIHYKPKTKTRVVFDLLPDKEVVFKHEFDTKKNALVISLYHAGTEPDSRPDVTEEKKDETSEDQGQAKKATLLSLPSFPVEADARQPEEEVTAGLLETGTQQPEAKPWDTQPATLQEDKQTPIPAEIPENENSPGLPILSSITFDNSSNRGEMVLFKLNKFHPPIVFGVEDGLPRVVCDFKNAEVAPDIPSDIKTDGKYVQSIRIGKENSPKKVRVVLDLLSSKNYDLQQVFFKDDNLFVIIINSLSNSMTKEELEKLEKPLY